MSANGPNANGKGLPPLTSPGSYRLWFSWSGVQIKGHTLDEIFQMDGGAQALIEILNWSKLKDVDPNAGQYIEEFIHRDAKRNEVFKLVHDEMRATARAVRRKAGTGGSGANHAQRERQKEFGF